MTEKLYILDAHSLIYQVFHAISELTSPSGMPTNAVFGFVRDIQFLRREKDPDYLICSFDSPGKTFRHEIYPEYKANRSAMPEDLRPQIEMIQRILTAYRIPVLSAPGIEADDFLTSVAAEAGRRGIHAYLCSADKDIRQAVGDHATMYDLRRNRLIDRAYIQKDWGITPEQVVDYQTMVGDSTDNVPGIAGVGPKTARSLLEKYGTFEEIYQHIDEIPGKKMRENFYRGREAALMSRQLVRLKTDLPLPEDWDEWRMKDPDSEGLAELFGECGFHRFAEEIGAKISAQNTWQADYRIVRTPLQLDSFLTELADQSRISFDLETTSLRPTEAQIVGFAICWEPAVAYYIAARGPEGETELEPTDVLERLRTVLENPEVEKVGQNLKYDMTVLRNYDVQLAGLSFDTMVASYLLNTGERNHNLDALSQRYLGHRTIKITELFEKPAKDKKHQIRMEMVPLAKIGPYAAEDADVALRLTNILEPRLKEQGELGKLFEELERPLIEVLVEMEHNGIRVDPSQLAELSSEFAQRLETIREDAQEAAGREFNLESPIQLRTILFEELGLPVIKRTKTGPSTDSEVLEELASLHPLCSLLLEHRRLAKLKGTYLDALPALIHPETGRIHASFNQTVTATGRLSSSDPNLQNIPVRTEEGRQIRQAFLPRSKSEKLLSADYSQIELRMLAHFSGDQNLRRAFAEDLDIHAAVAAEIEGTELDLVTSEMRRRAKAVNFGIMYGLSPFGLARQLKIDQGEAARFIDAYFDRYPGIEQFFTEVLTSAEKNGYVSTILGRRRPISGIKNTTGRNRNLSERTAINTVIQGSAADLIKIAMVSLHHRLKTENLRARMLLQIHDELVFEVDADRVEELAQVVREEMTEALRLDDVPLKVDIAIGPNWLDLAPLEIEVGQTL